MTTLHPADDSQATTDSSVRAILAPARRFSLDHMVYVTEELLLLAYDDDKGYDNSFTNLSIGLAGAAMLDLALAERISISEERVAILDARLVGHPVLDDVLQQIAQEPKQRKISTWLNKVSWGLPNRVRDGLVAEGVLKRQDSRILGLFKSKRYMPGKPEVEQEVRDRLERVVRERRVEDAQTVGLVSLIHTIGLTDKSLPMFPASEAKKTLKAISQEWDDASSNAAGRAVKAQQQAMQAAIAATMVTTMVAGSGT